MSELARMLLAAVVALHVGGCSGGHGGTGSGEGGATLTIKGSDTMVILAQRFAEQYMRTHSGATIQVSGGGSGTGIAALLNGTTDIATASRPIKDSERAQLQERQGESVHETSVAIDAIAVYVHRENRVRSLTVGQLAAIFRGEIDNWSELGGPNRTIVLYSRENNSGTYQYFKEHVLEDRDFAMRAQTLPGTAAVINAVTLDRYGIGYGGIGYGGNVRIIPIAGEDGRPIPPTMQNTTAGRYPLSRFLYMYTAGEPTGLAADFIAWTLTEEGQELAEAVGFFPMPIGEPRAEGTSSVPEASAPLDAVAVSEAR